MSANEQQDPKDKDLAIVEAPVVATVPAHSDDQAGAGDLEHDKADETVRDTSFVGLTKLQALRVFWRACLFCGICVLGAMEDGYQYALPGRSPHTRSCPTTALSDPRG